MRHPDREPDPGWPRAATPEPAAFLLGLSLAFVVLGYGAGLLGELFFVYDRALRIVAGLLLIVFGLAVANVVRLPFLHRELRLRLTRHPGGLLGSAVVGMAFGVCWTPCVGPVLAGVLALAGSAGDAGRSAHAISRHAPRRVPAARSARAIRARGS